MELRKDYLLDRWVIISEIRHGRPKQFKEPSPSFHAKCPFCKGNETLTPEEITRIEENGEWVLRVFPNAYPAVSLESPHEILNKKFFKSKNAYGYHEIIVDTPRHDLHPAEIEERILVKLFNLIKDRINNLQEDENIQYVAIFKNHGKESGASIEHSHWQIIAYNHEPENIKEKIKAVENFHECPYCRIIDLERHSPRFCFENKSFIAITPFASRFPYELLILSKEHLKDFNEFNQQHFIDLAEMLKKSFIKLKQLDASFNLLIFYSPRGKSLHFHIEILPRLNIFGGFEFLTGTIINTLAPETAARFYRH